MSYPSAMKTNQRKAEVYVGFLPFVVMEDGSVEGPHFRGPVSEEDHGGFTGYWIVGVYVPWYLVLYCSLSFRDIGLKTRDVVPVVLLSW